MTSLLATTMVAALASGSASTAPAGDRALIVVGLPGDDEHEMKFRDTSKRWRDWLTGPLAFPSDGVTSLFGPESTRDAIGRAAADLREGLDPDGRLWVFVLGHANVDEGQARFHLPGPDPTDDEFAALFKDVRCREQVFWLTTSCAGWFLPSLSAEGRIVVAATARDQEFNATEFPHALADVAGRPAEVLDADRNGKVSVWELFVKTAEAVEARFASDERAPTEHPQLDDDGDGRGSEPDAEKPADGKLAKATSLPTPPAKD